MHDGAISSARKAVSVETLDKIDLDKAFNFYKDRFADFSNFTFYLVGNIDLQAIRSFVEIYIASLPAKNRKESWKDLGVHAPKGHDYEIRV